VTPGRSHSSGVDVSMSLNGPRQVRRGIAMFGEGRRVFGHLPPARKYLLAATSMHRYRVARAMSLMNHDV